MNLNSLNHHYCTLCYFCHIHKLLKYWLIPWNWPNLLHKYICFFIMALNTEGNVFKWLNFIFVGSRLIPFLAASSTNTYIHNPTINFLINSFFTKNMCYIHSLKSLVVHSFYLFHFSSGVCCTAAILWKIKFFF